MQAQQKLVVLSRRNAKKKWQGQRLKDRKIKWGSRSGEFEEYQRRERLVLVFYSWYWVWEVEVDCWDQHHLLKIIDDFKRSSQYEIYMVKKYRKVVEYLVDSGAEF